MSPSRSDRWQAKFRRNFAQSDSNHGQPRHLQRARSAKFPAQTAGLLPGVQRVFYITRYFLEDIASVRLTGIPHYKAVNILSRQSSRLSHNRCL